MKQFGKLILLTIGWMATSAHGQQSGIQIGEVTLYPTVGLSVGYDDNVTRSSADQAESSTYYLVSPAVRLLGGSSRSQYEFVYAIEHGRYDRNLDDFTDHSLTGLWDYEPTGRSQLSLSGRYLRGHDGRGEGVRDFFGVRPELAVDEWEEIGIDGRYRYGANGARGRLELWAGRADREYRNNRQLTEVLDHNRQQLGAGFQWRVAQKSSLLVEAGYTTIDYDVAGRDSDERFIGVGALWEATAKTDGRASFRYLEKNFDDDSELPGYAGEAWEISVRWRPKDYSVVEAATSKLTDEALTAGGYVVREQVDLTWRHEWRPRLSTFLDAAWVSEDYDRSTRSDDAMFYGLGVSYEARHWLNVGFSYRYEDRDSSREFDYSRNRLLLSFEITP